MNLYAVTLYDIKEMELSLLGVFSSSSKAVSAGMTAMRERANKEPQMLDWDHDDHDQRYFFDGYTLTVTDLILDQTI